MKKFFTLILCAVAAMSVYAQQDFNRLLVRDIANSVHPYALDRIDSIYFANVEGRIAADIDIQAVQLAEGDKPDMIKMAVKRTEGCRTFRVSILKETVANVLTTPLALENYFNQTKAIFYDQDFTAAEMTNFGFPLQASTKYYIVTLGYDEYGTACEMVKKEFTTPARALVGDPQLTYVVKEVTPTEITITFTPNDGVAGYAATLYEAGTAQQQFEQWGARFGFANLGDMIKAWGFKGEPGTEKDLKWNNNKPNTSYEIYVQAWDVNGTLCPMIIIPVTTAKKGGPGEAKVTIEVKNFEQSEQGAYYQNVRYEANDQTSASRNFIMEAEAWDKTGGPEAVAKLMQSEQYARFDIIKNVDEAKWEAEPNKTYYAGAVARNMNDEWGPFTYQKFTTPDAPGAVTLGSKPVPTRAKVVDERGRVPASLLSKMKENGVKLVETAR